MRAMRGSLLLMSRSSSSFTSLLLAVFVVLTGCKSSLRPSANKSAANFETLAPSDPTPLSETFTQSLAHYAAGLSFDLRGESKLALEEYVLSAIANPEFEPVVVESSRRLLRAREFDRAIDFISKRLSQPAPPESLYPMLGLAYAAVGKTNEAVSACQLAVKKAPLNLAGYIQLSQLYTQAGKTNAALSVIDNAARQPSVDPAYWLALTELLTGFESQKSITPPEAKIRILSATDKAMDLKPEHPEMRQRIADLYFRFSQFEKAEGIYEDLWKKYPEHLQIREKLTNLYLRSGKQNKAAELIESFRQSNPTNPQVYYLLGTLAYEAKDYQKAADNYATVLRLDPGLEQVYYDLSGLLITLKSPGAALDLLEKARAKFKLNFTLEFYSGVALGLLEKFPEALNHFTSAEIIAKANEPSRLNHLFYYQLGGAHERVGNIPDAVSNLKKALSLQTDYADAQNYLAYMWAERGENLEEAEQLITKALKSIPDNSAFLDTLAWVLHQQGNHREALKQIKLAIAKSPQPDATLIEHFGDIHLALKQTAEAANAWRESLRIQPNEKVSKKLQNLIGIAR